MGPRAGLSSVLILGALVLVVAIAVGNSMGNRVLGQVGRQLPSLTTTPIPSASPSAGEDALRKVLWKRRQVLSVATDPAFPDPRVTPEPPPEPTDRPRRVKKSAPRSEPTPIRTPEATPAPRNPNYTSPPLLIPMKSHAHDDESPSPAPADASAAPTRGATPNPAPSSPTAP